MINKEFIEHNFSKGIPLIHAVGYFIAVEWYRSNYGSLTLLLSSVCSGGLVPQNSIYNGEMVPHFSCFVQRSCRGAYISVGMERMSPFVSNVKRLNTRSC